ncbi:MAG: YceI family protein [Candidatus Krumholzibacteria bacterium]|jgi:polyisoprenoid-binding protein YceI|nr:YceI family protein [Candidatus Krumholzibacteria bacterium]
MRKTTIVTAVLLLTVAAAAQAATYKIDPSHSAVSFKVRHLMISTVRGSFDEFSGSFTYLKDNPAQWQVAAEIQTASVNTNDDKRDDHLRTADFFDVEKFPTMTFRSTKVTGQGERFKLHGDLTLLGVTKPVVFDLEITGETIDPWGNHRVGFSAIGKLDRKEWGMTWSTALDSGGVMVGDEVGIELEIQGIQES